jgi:D-alanine transaminase
VALELAREGGLAFAIRPVTKEETLAADEMWLSSSTKEVLAVTTLDGKAFGGGRPGHVFQRLYHLFQESKPRPRRAA